MVILLVALSLVVLLVIAALVLDVGFAYAAGRQEQTVADLSALAAARHLPGDPIGACQDGWDYVKANLPDLAGANMPCASFPPTCDAATPPSPHTVTSDGYTITFRYPVSDGDPLMSSQKIVQPYDGTDPCERFGVKISHDDPAFFSSIGGIGHLYPHVKAVARYWTGPDTGNVANLVSLDPIGCTGIGVNGVKNSQNLTEVIVNSYSPGPGEPSIPGAIAVDSNGTGSTCGTPTSGGKTTIDAVGQATIFAKPTSGMDLGEISLYAMPADQTTCSVLPSHDCNPSEIGTQILPQPINSPSRITRAPADHAYNCKSSYPVYDDGGTNAVWGVPIAGCDTSDAKSNGPYIHQLTTVIQNDITNNTPPATWTVFPTCNPKASGTYTGNYWVNCPGSGKGSGFNVGNGIQIVFQGNVIFNGNVNQTGGELDFEGDPNTTSNDPACEPASLGFPQGADAGNCLDYSIFQPSSVAPPLFTDPTNTVQLSCQLGTTSGDVFSPYSPAPMCASFVYLNGSMTPSGGILNLNGTFVYGTASSQGASNFACAPQSSPHSLTDNGGGANWIAPTDGLFDNLALWSESGSGNNSNGSSSTASFGLHGGGNTTVDGVFFTPCAQFNISGGFTNPQTAQFLTFQLSVGGGSQLTMEPVPNRQLPTAPSGSLLIR